MRSGSSFLNRSVMVVVSVVWTAAIGAVEIVNSGFELPDVKNEKWRRISALEDKTDGVSGGWTFTGDNCGVAYNGSTWSATAPEGFQVAYMKHNNLISTSFTTTRMGTYKLNFMVAERAGKYPAGHLAILIDDVQVAYWTSAEINNNDQFQLFTVDLGILSAATRTLTFQNFNIGEDAATLIDDVNITLEKPFNFWNPDPISSNWSDTVWATTSGGTPDQSWSSGDLAIFDQSQSYTVTVDTAESAGIVYVDAGDVTLEGIGGVSVDDLRIAFGATFRGAGERYLKIGSTPVTLNGTLDLTSLSDSQRALHLTEGSGELVLGGSLRVSGTQAFTGTISGSGDLTKIGDEKMFINNTLTGAINVQAGYLALQSTASGAITVATNAGVTFTSDAALLNELADSANSFSNNAMIGLHNDALMSDPALGGVDYGNLRFLKTGIGVLKISSSSVLSGVTSGVVIADGEFEYGGTDAVAPNVPIEVRDGARLYLNNIVEVFNVSHPIKIAGNISYDGTGDGALKIRIVARIANLNAPITVIDDAKINLYSSNSTVNFNAPINGNGNLVFSSGGAGELHAHQIYFNAPSTFAGDVTFMNDLGASSYFHWGVDDAMPTNSVLSLGCMNYREFTMKTGIDLKGYNQRTAGISDGAKVQVRTERFITNSVANLITLTMDVGTENSLVYSAPIGGKIALVKCGEGTQMLTGDGSARSGNITVQHGGLLVDESYLLQADQVEVSHGAVLSLADAEAIQNSSSQTELFAGTDKLIAGEPAKIDIAAGVEVAVWRFAKDGVYKRAGTWGSTGSGADNVDDEIFIGGGILQVLETGPASATIILVR